MDHGRLAFKAKRVAIDSELLGYMKEEELEAVRIIHASISKHKNEYLTNKKLVEEVLASRKKREVMINIELKAVAKWKKRNGDAAIPSTKLVLMQRCTETMERMDQTLVQILEENGLHHHEVWI
jgi:hypothetical protein